MHYDKLFFLLAGLLCAFSLSADDWKAKLDPQVLEELEAGARVEVIVAFHEQADVSMAYRLKGKEAKGQFVYQQVRQVAERTQMRTKGILSAKMQEYRSFAIVNALMTEVDLSLARAIAELEEVANLQPNPWTALDRPTLDLSPAAGGRGVVEWGVQRINADDVWALGFRGEGVTVGGQDTGYEWEHPTIIEQYRGYDGTTADHNYHWHDAIREINLLHNDSIISPDNNPCGLDVNIPCDDNNHGTHTMGTMVGDDGDENQIGVAPAASWIGCRNMERGWGSPASYIECFDWFLAPTDLNGENPDPAQAPHVINNSWSCPEIEGCNPMNFALMETAVEALRAAGVVVVVSAGNSGPNCNTVSTPSAIFEGSFSVGASRDNDTIANFSSRGSVAVDSSFRLKPNVVAPGVGVRSATRNGGFATWNGTSMAGPHVAGAVALMISAAPQLAGEVDTIEAILQETAVPLLSDQDCTPFLGMAIPNATYGYGRIDVLAAVERAMQVVATEDTYLSEWSLFPNPSKGNVWLNVPVLEGKATLDVYSADGQLLRSVNITGGLQSLDLSSLPAGLYSYRLYTAQEEKVGKLIKQ